jgi:hypothetical protein
MLLLACLPYAILVATLPKADEFPNEGGGEARLSAAFQQLGAYTACGAVVVLLALALWSATRSGGIAGWARHIVLVVVPAACAAMVFAIAAGFEQPGPLLPLGRSHCHR